MNLSFRYHSLRRDLSNFSLLKHRDYDGFMVSMHQSGTHWLKHMLASAICHKNKLPPPRFSHANDVICGVKDMPPDSNLPRIVSTHSIPHLLLQSVLVHQYIKFPPYIVLVRDIRSSLISNYEKWKEHYRCDFSTYLRGDVAGRRYDSDIWWCIRFCNAWGGIVSKFPDRTLLLKYEDLQRDPLSVLVQINDYWGLQLGKDSLRHGISESSKEKMAQKKDPNTPLGLTVVREDQNDSGRWFDEQAREYFDATREQYLKYSFAYDYTAFS